ncbi:TIGR02530 family flagellar biosynthesis protein [Brevibacillus daliensis]|uniref:TIGR02530 family flagellar biosynthesis protein n=1 Tax=Brevibacillus daliensis TaxID=2892995 RepID=UPI001E58262D|nr:TIGR02530 family flagellar biosynthesis protein [Brevibacillus daliensis]
MNQPIRVGSAYFPTRTVVPHVIDKQKTANNSFEQIFAESLQQATNKQKVSSLSFSQHALQRLQESNITLMPDEITRLENGVQKARQKGARETLVLMDQVAYVVSVPNQKVITAVEQGRMKDSVFTNIDSAVFV